MLLVVGLYAGALAMDLHPVDPLGYRPGQYLPDDVRARVAFEVYPERLLREGQEAVKRSTPATFQFNQKLADNIAQDMKRLPDLIEAALQPPPEPSGTDTQPAKAPAPPAADPLLKRFGLGDAKALAGWKKHVSKSGRKRYLAQVEQLAERLKQAAVISGQEVADQQEQRTVTDLWLVYPGGRKLKELRSVVRCDRSGEVGEEADRLVAAFDPAIRQNLKTYLLGVFVGSSQPLYRYDAKTTQKDIKGRIDRLKADPPTEAYAAGQVLVRASRRSGPEGAEVEALDQESLKLLAAEHRAFLADEYRRDPWMARQRAAGRAAMLLLPITALCWYIWRYERRIAVNHWRGFAVVGVMLLMLGVSKVMGQVMGWNKHVALLPVIMTAVIMTIAYNHRFAIALAAALAAMTVLQLRADFGMLLVLLTGVLGSVVPMHEIRSRSKLIEVAALAAAAVLLAVVALGLARGMPVRFIGVDVLWAVVLTLLAGFLIQGVLPLIERMFRIATSMTLLEWCDASRPLLKRLAMEAPGTYNHSLQLGAMCEAAAEAIGARGLLARVGAYYHDIGKINKPDYFVENADAAGESRHDKLSPAMSMLVIIGHVKDGIEMAKEYGLPHVLHEFIVTHHGTTLVQYFYDAAAKQKNGPADRRPEEQQFRYPGPKPSSKEAGILMLADAAESSVRALSNPTAKQIEEQVRTMASRRLMDGQLDACDMMLREVHAVEASLIKSLCGIYHSRIVYPAPPGQKAAASEQAGRAETQEPETEGRPSEAGA